MFFATDTVQSAITTDESTDSDSFDLDAISTTVVDNPPWKRAFETDTFYTFDVVIARPIEQQYNYDGQRRTFKKPADELKRAAWTFDNVPYPLTHPDSGPIRDVGDVHGFVRNPRYVEDYDEREYGALVETLYVPTNDDEALSFISDNRAVSVGFYNDLDWETDDDDIDAYQRHIFGDHVAGVRRGRCPVEEGCGVQTDVSSIEALSDHSQPSADGCTAGSCTCGEHVPSIDAPSGIYVDDDGNWYGVAPSETSDDEPKYSLNDCNDVKDAYNLRNNGDYDIDTSTLVSRIKRASESHDCTPQTKPWADGAEHLAHFINTHD
jgi:hypothetical protein